MTPADIAQAIIDLDLDKAKLVVEKLIGSGVDPEEILDLGLVPGMKKVGEFFSQKIFYVPEVLLAAEAFYAGFNLVQPLIKKGKTAGGKGKIVMGVVEGDIHDIGKNIVKVICESSGYEIIDLGKDVPCDKFVSMVIQEKPQILAMSSLMTTTMTGMKRVIDQLEAKGIRERVRVIIGGAPVNEDYARSIGADGCGKDAIQALAIIDRISCKIPKG
jgi:corrinoid protein of di/trimethylamine methyltransferase